MKVFNPPVPLAKYFARTAMTNKRHLCLFIINLKNQTNSFRVIFVGIFEDQSAVMS